MKFEPIENKQLIERSSLLKIIANNDINAVPGELKQKAIQADSIYISVKEYKRLLNLHE